MVPTFFKELATADYDTVKRPTGLGIRRAQANHPIFHAAAAADRSGERRVSPDSKIIIVQSSSRIDFDANFWIRIRVGSESLPISVHRLISINV